jgi:hypothetical protein
MSRSRRGFAVQNQVGSTTGIATNDFLNVNDTHAIVVITGPKRPVTNETIENKMTDTAISRVTKYPLERKAVISKFQLKCQRAFCVNNSGDSIVIKPKMKQYISQLRNQPRLHASAHGYT